MNERLYEALESEFADVTPEKVKRLMNKWNVVALPCAIGTRIYIVGEKYRHGNIDRYVNSGSFCWGDVEKLGKTVFLSKKEAIRARDSMGV